MLKRYLRISSAAVAVICLSFGISSADPAADINHDGKWKLNTEKSFWSDDELPADLSVTIETEWRQNQVIFKASDTTNPAKPLSVTIISTLDDKTTPVPDNPNLNEIRIKKLASNVYQILEQKNGNVIVGQRWEFSQDGKSFTRWGVGPAPKGKSRAFYEWYDRKD